MNQLDAFWSTFYGFKTLILDVVTHDETHEQALSFLYPNQMYSILMANHDDIPQQEYAHEVLVRTVGTRDPPHLHHRIYLNLERNCLTS